MKDVFIILSILLVGGFCSLFAGYKTAMTRNRAIEKGERDFKIGVALIAFCMIGFFTLFYWHKETGKKESKKEMVFVVQKKLNDHKAEILAKDIGDEFVIEGDEVLDLPKTESVPESLSDIKKM